jgi:aspartyl-tRNA(Asn)/glutamyl-tRNA(Gln) amidotransferase subunit C
MPLDPDEVKRIAALARIAVTDTEVASVREQLNNILGLVERMQAIDTKGVEPMSHAQDVVLRLREDKVSEGDQHEKFQAIAPAVERDLYLVPKVIE